MPDPVPTDDRIAWALANQPSDKRSESVQREAQRADVHAFRPCASNKETNRQPVDKITQAVKQLYTKRLGRKPKRVSCELLSSRFVIWIEESITPVDKLLYAESDMQARSLCSTVDAIIKKQVTQLIEQHLNTQVITLIFDTCYEQNCTGMIAQLATEPQDTT